MEKFEERLERLQKLSNEIKNPDIQMDKALELFEEGIKLARGMEKEIDKIENKIQILMNAPTTPEEKPELDLFSSIQAEK